MSELESALRLSIIYTTLLTDLACIGNFEWQPDELHQAVQIVSDAVDHAHDVKLAETIAQWQSRLWECLPEGDYDAG